MPSSVLGTLITFYSRLPWFAVPDPPGGPGTLQGEPHEVMVAGPELDGVDARAADAAPLTRAFRAYHRAAFRGHDMVDRCARHSAFNDPPSSSAERFLLLS
jgi:hypothetical protein